MRPQPFTPRGRTPRGLAALLLSLALALLAAPSALAVDNIVTVTKAGGGKTIADEAREWLDDYGKLAQDRWKAGGSKLYPPSAWSTDPVVRAQALKDSRLFTGKFGTILGKGAARAIPWVAAGLTAYSVCTAITDKCKIFGRQTDDPGVSIDPTPRFLPPNFCTFSGPAQPGCAVPSGWVFDALPNVGTGNECSSDVGPVWGIRDVVPDDGSMCFPEFWKAKGPTTWYYYAVSAAPDSMLEDAAEADHDAGSATVPSFFDEDDYSDLAGWLDDNQRVRQHIASEIDPDVPDPYIDGTKVPQPRSTETYEQYGERLRAAGLLGTLKFANEYAPAPAGTKAGRVYSTNPEPGTQVQVGSAVTYRAAPMDGTATDPAPDTGTAPGATPENPTHTQVGTPPPSGSYVCGVATPTPNLSPLAVPVTDKWPFGFFGWARDIANDLNQTGGAPVVAMPEIAGKSWTLDLSAYDSQASLARSALGWAGSIFIIAWITQVALDRRITHESKD